MEVLFNFCFINLLPNHMVEAAEPLQPLFAPQEFKPNKVDYFEGALQLLFYKLCMKMIDHSSRSTLDPGPSRSRFWVRKFVMPSKSLMLHNFCFVIFCQVAHLRLQNHPDPILSPPDPGFRVRSKARRLRPDHVTYWEGSLQLLFYKLCQKMVLMMAPEVHGAWSFQIQIMDLRM